MSTTTIGLRTERSLGVFACRAIATDDHGAAWIGSEAGNVKRVELCSKDVANGKPALFLEHSLTLRHQPKSRRSSTTFSNAADMDDLTRADSARGSADSHPTSEGAPTGNLGVRAHTGPVTAVEAQGSLLFTAGGNQNTAALHQWGQSGVLHRSHKLKDLGEGAPCSSTRYAVPLGIILCPSHASSLLFSTPLATSSSPCPLHNRHAALCGL